MTSKELGQLFLKHYPVNEMGISDVAKMEDLIKLDPSFETTNGCTWIRATSWLGKRFYIERTYSHHKIATIKLIGFNTDVNNHGGITPEIRKHFQGKPCCVTGCVHNRMEIDHKNGGYNQQYYGTEDFQAMCAAVNDAKREHCKVCHRTHKKFDARLLGYSVAQICGDADYNGDCTGCYWANPQEWNRIISSSFVK